MPADAKTNKCLVPSLDSDPVYAALIQRRDAIKAEKAALEAEWSELVPMLKDRAGAKHASRLAELLGDDHDAVPVADAERANELSDEIDLRRRALEELDNRITVARVQVSKTITDALRPEYGRRVQAICEALVQAHEASVELHGLIAEFEAKDIAWSRLEPLQPRLLGGPTDAHSHLRRYLKDALKAGYLTPENLPAALR